MLVTPLKVFASVHSTQGLPDDSTHRLLVAKTEEESTPHLLIQDLSGTDTGFTRLRYSDCHFDAQGQFPYTERLDRLIYDFTRGYSSAAVSINAGYDQARLVMAETVLDRLKIIIASQTSKMDDATARKIKIEYGFLGFTDDYCYNYQNSQRITNSTATQMDISTTLQPLELTTINNTLESIKSVPRKYPTLLICRLTNTNKRQSDFAWIDIPSLSPLSNQRHCTNSYTEFENLIKSYSNPQSYTKLNSKYSMAHVLSQYFSGSYQTMVFTHFAEFGKYGADDDLNILEYTVDLQNIKCIVARSRPNAILLEQLRNQELQDELAKNKEMVKNYKTSNADLQQENSQLKDQVVSHEALNTRLTFTKNIARAAMARQKTTSEIEVFDMKDQMNQLRISLMEANVSSRSYQFTLETMEYQSANEKRTYERLNKLRKENELYIRSLEKKIGVLEAEANSVKCDSDKLKITLDEEQKKWLLAEGVYLKQLGDMEKQIQDFTKQIDSLSRECEKLMSKNESGRTEMQTKMDRMERVHEFELKALRDQARQQLEQAELDKARMATLMHKNLMHARAGRNNASLEEQYQSQQNPLQIQHLQNSILGKNPSASISNPTHDDQVLRQHEYLSQTSYIHLSDDDHDMTGTSLPKKTTMKSKPVSSPEQAQPRMIRPLHIEKPTPPTPPPAATTPSENSPIKSSEPKPVQQSLKAIHSRPPLSISQSPPLSPILPAAVLGKSALLDLENSPKSKTIAIERKNINSNQQTSNSTTKAISQPKDLFKNFGSIDSDDDDGPLMLSGYENGHEWLANDDHDLKILDFTRPKNTQQISPNTKSAELENAKENDDFCAPPRGILLQSAKSNTIHQPPKKPAAGPKTKTAKKTISDNEGSSQIKQHPASQHDNEQAIEESQPAAKKPRRATKKPRPVAQKSQPAAQEPQPAAQEPQLAAHEPQPAAQEPQLAAHEPQPAAQETQPAAQESQLPTQKLTTRKRRKLRVNKAQTQMDEAGMSPVLHGYAAKYFENTP